MEFSLMSQRGERSCIGKARIVREQLEEVGDMTPEIGRIMGDPTQCHRLISRMCDNWSTKDADEFYDKLEKIDTKELHYDVKKAQQDILTRSIGHKKPF